jgi:hypothetical protein
VVVLPIKSEEFFLSGLKVIFKFNMDETQTNTSPLCTKEAFRFPYIFYYDLPSGDWHTKSK